MERKQPYISIIIPTFGRPRQLSACLQAVARMDYPSERFEVIVVDDGSEKPPADVVALFFGLIDVTLLTQSHAGPSKARNTGAGQARGRWLAFIDDDCLPEAAWLKNLAGRFVEAPDCAIGGRTFNLLERNPYSSASQMIIDAVYEYYNSDPGRARFFATNNLALPKEPFLDLGGFDEGFTTSEDREFCDRWLHNGYGMVYAPEAMVFHAHRLTLDRFWRQHFGYGCGAYRFHQARAQISRKDLKLEPRSFYQHLLTYPLLKERSVNALALWALVIISQMASAAGFMMEKRRSLTLN